MSYATRVILDFPKLVSVQLGIYCFRDALKIAIEGNALSKLVYCLDLSSLQFIELGFCALGARDTEWSTLSMRSNDGVAC